MAKIIFVTSNFIASDFLLELFETTSILFTNIGWNFSVISSNISIIIVSLNLMRDYGWMLTKQI